MNSYGDNVFDKATNRPIENVNVYVYTQSGMLASLFDVSSLPIVNPVTTDHDGAFLFYAADGLYRAEFVRAGKTLYIDEQIVVGLGASLPDDIIVALQNPASAAFIGSNGPSNVQADLNARPSVTQLAASTGATLIGYFQSTVAAVLSGSALYDIAYGVIGDGIADDSAATNAFLAALTVRGGVGVMKPGPRKFSSQVFIDRAPPTHVKIFASGVSIKTTHNGSAFRVVNNYDYFGTDIHGMVVDEQINATSKAGFEQLDTGCVTWHYCGVSSNGDNMNATYSPWLLAKQLPGIIDGGCYWTRWPMSWVRRTGSAFLSCGARLKGASNASRFNGIKLSGVTDGVILEAYPLEAYLANGVFIVDVDFEGVTNHAVRVIGSATANICPNGLVINNSRFESIGGSVLSLEGVTVDSPRWPQISNIAVDSSVLMIMNNPNGLRVDLDIGDDAKTERNQNTNASGHIFSAINATNDVVEFRAGNLGSGVSIRDPAGVLHSSWRYIASGVAELAGAGSVNVALSTIAGISGTPTRARNLRGSATLAVAATLVVPLPVAETNSSYDIQLTPEAANGGCWVTGKTASQFQINFNAAYTGDVKWLLVR